MAHPPHPEIFDLALEVHSQLFGGVLAAMRLLDSAEPGADGELGAVALRVADALPKFNPGRGTLAQLVAHNVKRDALRSKEPFVMSLFGDGDDDREIEIDGGGDPAVLFEILKSAAADATLAARQLSFGGTREVSNAAGISQRTAQRWQKKAEAREAEPQLDLFAGVMA